ncbi:MAG: beta strand repeat-containing protein [Phycisphaerales bacterium]
MPTRNFTILHLGSLLVAIAIGASSLASADTLTWTGAGDGIDFTLPTNWSPVKKPGTSDDCVVPPGPGQLEFTNQSTDIRSLTLGRPLLIQKCFSLALRSRLTLSGGTITIDDTGACAAISFNSGAPVMDGAGEIVVVNSGSFGAILDLTGGAQLTMGEGVAVRLGAGATGATASISIAQNCKLLNLGTIVQERQNGALQIRGTGMFSNGGLVHVSAGAVDIQTTSWVNDGVISLSGGAASVTGTYSTIGVVRNASGVFKLRGSYTGSELVADSDVGSLTLDGISLVGTSLKGNGRFYTSGTVTLNGCTLGTDLVVDGCSTLVINNGLTLEAGVTLACNRTSGCANSQIRLNSGVQSISGIGILDGPLVLSGAVQATIGSNITLRTTLTATTVGVTIPPDCSLVNEGTIVIDHLADYKINGGGMFVNAGAVSFVSAIRAVIDVPQWINLGLVDLRDTDLQLAGAFINEGIFWADKCALTSYGGSWTNHLSFVLNDSSVDTQHVSIVNSGEFDLASTFFHINTSSTSHWTNSGTVFMSSSQLDLDGQYDSIGDIQRVGGKLTISGTHSGPFLAATAATGDLSLWNVNFTGARFESSGGAHVTVEKKATFNGCVLATNVAVAGACASLSISAGMTLENATLALNNTPCDLSALGFIGTQAVAGTGVIQIDGTRNIGVGSAALVTFGSGITVRYGPAASASISFFGTSTASVTTNLGTIQVQQAGGRLDLSNSGAFDNQALIKAGPGEFRVGTLNGSLGDVTLAAGGIMTVSAGNFTVNKPVTVPSGATLSLAGTYSINQPITVLPGGKLSLLGTWTNNSNIAAVGSTATLGGTWANAGAISISSSALTFSGLPANLGNFTSTSNALTYTGPYNRSSLVADATTGDITLASVVMTGTTLSASGGAKFAFAGSAVTTFSACAFDGDIVFGPCVSARFRNGLTLLNGTNLILANSNCNGALTFDGSAQSIAGDGAIVFRASSSPTVMSAQSSPTLTIESGISLRVDADATLSLSPSIDGVVTIVNRGKVLMSRSSRTLLINPFFTNEGIVQATAGTISFNRGVTNVIGGTTGVLTGGVWRADGGSIVLGRRVSGIAAGTEFLVNSPPPYALTDFSRLAFNDGTLIVRNCTVSVTLPGAGGFTNTGALSVGAGGLLAVTGPVTLAQSGSLGVTLAGTTSPQFGRLTSTGAFTQGGSFTPTFSSPYVPIVGDSFSPVLRAASFAGVFASVCAEDNPQSLGVVPQIVPVDASTFGLSLVVSDVAGVKPTIVAQPQETGAIPDAHFDVDATPSNAEYVWRRNGAVLVDGPTGSGSTIAGAATSHLTILNAAASDAGEYDVVVSTACTSVVSESALLRVCPADLNNDNLVDDGDFLIFVSAYNLLDCTDPAMPAGCPADLDHDLLVTDTDFQLFVPAYNALLCP